MTTKPYFWIQRVYDALTETKQIPLWGSPPPFPWNEFTRSLKEQFGLKEFVIKPEKTTWLTPEFFLDGLGADPLLTALNLTPIRGSFFFVMGVEDARRLTTFLLTDSGEEKGFSDDSFVTGFFRFIILNIIDTFQEVNLFEGIALKVGKETPLPTEGALSIDVKIVLNGNTLWGRVICPHTFHHSFQRHFATKPAVITSKELTSSITVPLKLEAASATLRLSEWQSLAIGDFIILDHCGYDPDQHRGSFELVLGTTPLFQARLKDGVLKILDYSFYSEEKTLMEESEPNEGKEPVEEPAITPKEEPLEDIPEETRGEAPEHLWAEEKGKAPIERIVAASEVPISLTVEVGRLQMSLSQLLELEPGNTLELTTRPEDGVFVTLQGKPVAKAELVKINEVLGIKILNKV